MDDAWLEELAPEDCVLLLRAGLVGRIAVVADDVPVVLPVNYRVVEADGTVWIALRTRPGNIIDQIGHNVAFEVDSIDIVGRRGWSVLVRGRLRELDASDPAVRARFDSEPWLSRERDSWLAVEPFAISGRRLHGAEQEWVFHIRGYL